MAIDTAEKRRAVAAFAFVFLAPGVTPNASKDSEWRQESLWSYPGISAVTEAEDLDDITPTVRVDVDGATVRPIRITTAHAADGERQADVIGYDRSHRLDRHYVVSSRSHRTPNVGCRFAVEFTGARAGETFALDRMVAWLSATEQRPRAADTTARADVDGATAAVPTWLSRISSDAQRAADFATAGGTTQDRWIARHPVATAQGLGKVFHLEIETDGRAGACFALDRLVAWVSDAAMARPGDET